VNPKILHIDIETAPASAYVWKMFDETVGLEQLITPGRMICWAAKWHRGAMFAADERKGLKQMLQPLHQLLTEADAVVTFNGDKFDLPKVNGEFLAAGMSPVPPTPSIDLRRSTRRLGYISGKLQFLSGHLGLGQKIDTGGFKLWRDVMAGDQKAWARMVRYNKHDVVLLERLYKRILPYIKNHPVLYMGHGSCKTCGSKKLHRRGERTTKAFAIERLHCTGCNSWSDGARRKVA
jgi:uncharacterized protein YprB with RNaseH-like and TPR domain